MLRFTAILKICLEDLIYADSRAQALRMTTEGQGNLTVALPVHYLVTKICHLKFLVFLLNTRKKLHHPPLASLGLAGFRPLPWSFANILTVQKYSPFPAVIHIVLRAS
jgi:hypothetical protein